VLLYFLRSFACVGKHEVKREFYIKKEGPSFIKAHQAYHIFTATGYVTQVCILFFLPILFQELLVKDFDRFDKLIHVLSHNMLVSTKIEYRTSSGGKNVDLKCHVPSACPKPLPGTTQTPVAFNNSIV
jgi:hypothetical protein